MFLRKRPIIRGAALASELRDIGLPGGGVVVLHSSLSSLGWVSGGARAVVEAFLDVIGPDGVLMTPTFTRCFAPREGAPRTRQGPFDIARTPSTVGSVSETVRRRPDARRSMHPIHSVAAVGPRADEFTAGHDLSSDFGPETPFRRAMKRNGAIFLLGVGQNVNSTVHALEDILNMPYLVTEKALLARPVGEPATFLCRKCPIGHRDFYNPESSKWNRAIQDSGVVRHAQLGCARVQVMESAALARAGLELLQEAPDLLLCDSPDCEFCVWAKDRIQRFGIRRPTLADPPEFRRRQPERRDTL